MESRTIERDGDRLHGLWRPGEGTPVLLVPGAMADARSFGPVAEALEHPAPVLVLNRRGRAPSGALGPDYGFETEVADLLAWVAHLGKVRLAGWSYGGTIALETAARPEAAALVEGPVVAYEPVLAPFGRDVLPALSAADPERAVEIVNVDLSGFPRERVEELRSSPDWPVLCSLAAPLAAELAAIDTFRPDPEAWSRVRAELILGERNRGVEPYGPAFDRVADLLPDSRTTLLPGQGHLAHAEDPVALGRLMGELLSRPAVERPVPAAR
ncbi:alpha/beta fold hydrolase [Streptomyces sp. NPDC059740]|uniref:alpha/beta fold hydrolase n=1 Tax=Streptomyces sp. NPDC059740 TaxID=3346926 RepID=UPI00365241CF